jgi:tetratricopeptide (TPR) repeat protein
MTENEEDGEGPLSGLTTLDADGARPAAVPDAGLPPQIGGFTILRKLGEGGMGIVYEAQQQSPRRRVALKVVRGGQFVDEKYLALFRREAETLARLVHPNIAAIYEAGRTEDGQHFFTMELVEGRTLSAYARERLGGERPGPEALRARIALFEAVCRAVHHAHQRGVIHRDLKPSNIVVSEAGEVKVLDFGLARITDADVAVGTVLSEVGTIRGTLPYMSPEQTRGDSRDLDFRTDVYSLGVVLYEILSGRLPYDALSGSIVQAIRVICEEAPRPLPESIGGIAVDADLRTIVLKALEKDRDNRYHSAAALADDLGRYLAGQPILAHPPSTLYQLRKLAARNRGVVAAVAAIAVLLVALAVTSTVQAQRVRRERDRAAAEAAKAGAINAFLQEALGAADPWGKGSRSVTLLDALRQARVKSETAFRGQPLVEAAVLQTIGVTLANLAEFAEAETALQASLRLREGVLGRRSGETAVSLQHLSGLYENWRKIDESERYGREAYELARDIHGSDSPEAAEALNTLATAVRRKGRFDEAKGLAVEMRRIAKIHAGTPGAAGEAAERVENAALLLLVSLALDQQDFGAMEALASERLARLRSQYPGPHPLTAGALNDVAVAKTNNGDLEGAEAFGKEALEMDRATLGQDHPEVASALENLGNVYFRQGKLDQTARLLGDVLEMRRRVLGDDSEPVARTLANMAAVQKRAGQTEASERTYREAIPRLERALGKEHTDVAVALIGYGDLLRTQRRFAEAEAFLLRGIRIWTTALGDANPLAQRAFKSISTLYADWGRPAMAAPYAARIAPEPTPPPAK